MHDFNDCSRVAQPSALIPDEAQQSAQLQLGHIPSTLSKKS